MKIFTSILAKRIPRWADKKRILPEVRAGFQEKRDCQEQVFNLTGAIHIHLRRRRKVYALFIDFATAFPSNPHNKLWVKLHDLGMNTKILETLQNIYSASNLVVRIHEGHSDPIDFTMGLLP